MIIVTGGAGFIGSCFINKLNSLGYTDIIVVDNIGNTNKWKNLLNKSFLDFVDKKKFKEILEENKFHKYFVDVLSKFKNNSSNIESKINPKVEYIFHFGACSSTTEPDFNYLLENNYEYSKLMYHFALENNAKFIYASSAATYGLGESGYSESQNLKLRPLNGYGYSKQIFDIWLKNYGQLDNVIGLKFFNVFGPNEYHKANMSSMIYKSYLQIKEHNFINLFKSNTDEYKDGEQLRDFIYIKDTADLVWDIVKNNEFGIFNIGTGKARSWNDLAKSVFNTLDLDVDIRYIDMPDNIAKQYQNYTEADLNKINNLELNFKFRTLEDSINDYITNYLQSDWQYL